MRIVRWLGSDGPRIGYLDGESTVVPVAGAVTEVARRATRDPGWRPAAAGERLELEGLPLLAPVDPPGAVRDFYAFERHVATARARRGLAMEPGWYERPVFYFSNPATLSGPNAVIEPPPRTRELDFELELAWVVGEDLRGTSPAAAADAVVGFTVMNDWSARDVQREEMKLSLGPAKGKDFALSLGPVLVTADEMDGSTGAMRASVNGRPYSAADLSECWWSVAEMTAFAAEGSVVRAGDVFGSGTCGTGCILELALTHGPDDYPWLSVGDVVELEIEGIGCLRNTIGPRAALAWEPDPQRERPPRTEG